MTAADYAAAHGPTNWTTVDCETCQNLAATAVCVACGHTRTDTDPLVTTTDGYRVHHSHTTDPRSGLYGTAA